MLKYPILFVHGMGFRDSNVINYWGRIPSVFENDGNKVFYGYQDSNGTIEDNALVLKKRIEKIINETNTDKLNVIAHSKGGLDMRYAISSLGMGKYIASLTTVSTPHNGSKTIDKIMKLPKWTVKLVGKCSDIWLGMLGDKKPNAYKVFCSFSTEFAESFNNSNPDDPEVYYQSYAFVMKNSFSDIFMTIPHSIIYHIEGENDGLLTPASVQWGDFKGVFYGNSNRGISHCDEVDLRRCRFTRKDGDGVADVLEVYRSILGELKNKGL